MLYLADLCSVEKLGYSGSGVQWQWFKYGPFNNSLIEIENDLIQEGAISRETTQNSFGPEHRLCLTEKVSIQTNYGFAQIIEDIVSEFGALAPSSLRDFTYQTAPMEKAQKHGSRGDVLDLFDNEFPIPDTTSVLSRFQKVLDKLPPQTDVGDLSELANELDEWQATRAQATRMIIE